MSAAAELVPAAPASTHASHRNAEVFGRELDTLCAAIGLTVAPRRRELSS